MNKKTKNPDPHIKSMVADGITLKLGVPPNKLNKGKKMERNINVRIPDHTHKILIKLCKKYDYSASDIIRAFLMEFCDKFKKDAEPNTDNFYTGFNYRE